MANTGRYSYCPMAGKIRGNRRTLRDIIIRWLDRRNGVGDVSLIVNCSQPYYPTGYKK